RSPVRRAPTAAGLHRRPARASRSAATPPPREAASGRAARGRRPPSAAARSRFSVEQLDWWHLGPVDRDLGAEVAEADAQSIAEAGADAADSHLVVEPELERQLRELADQANVIGNRHREASLGIRLAKVGLNREARTRDAAHRLACFFYRGLRAAQKVQEPEW